MIEQSAARFARAGMMACAFLSAAVTAGCSRTPERTSARIAPRTGPPPLPLHASNPDTRPDQRSPTRTAGTYKIGKPYQIRGRWYVPAEDPNYDRSGVASWYGPDFHGKRTANGETYDMHGLSAAHPTLPLPSYVYVTNLANGRTLMVRVNDRGPYVQGRIIDLSKMTARLLGTEANGVGHVRVRYAGRAPLDGNTAAERQYLAAQPWYQTTPRMALGAE